MYVLKEKFSFMARVSRSVLLQLADILIGMLAGRAQPPTLER